MGAQNERMHDLLAEYGGLVRIGDLLCTDASLSPEQATARRILSERMSVIEHQRTMRGKAWWQRLMRGRE